jgi:hypothetical protein
MSGQTVGISDTFNHSRFFPSNAYDGELLKMTVVKIPPVQAPAVWN